MPKYDRAQDPVEYLQQHTTAVHAAGGSEKVMANWFPLVLKGAAQSWLMNLHPASIRSWQKLCDQFVGNFQGTCKWVDIEEDLYAVEQCLDKTLRQFIQHFSTVRNTIPGISPQAVMIAFKLGVRDVKMREKLGTKDIQSTAELFVVADECARAAEAREWPRHTKNASVAGLS